MAQHCQGSETSSNQFSLLPQASCLHPCKPSISVYDRSIYPNSKLIDIFKSSALSIFFSNSLVPLSPPLLSFSFFVLACTDGNRKRFSVMLDWSRMETRIHTAFVFGEVGSAKSHEDAICKFNEIEKNSWSWTKILHHFGSPNTFYNLAMGYKWCRIFFHHQYHRPQIWLWKVHWNLKIWPQNVYKIWLQNI